MQNVIKLRAAVQDYPVNGEKLSNDAENNTAVTSAGSKNVERCSVS